MNVKSASTHTHSTPKRRSGLQRRRGTIENVLTSSRKINVSSSALWERRTAEVEIVFAGVKKCFNKYDPSKKGILSIDVIYTIIGEALNQTPDIKSILNLVNAFSADDSCNMNLAEFSTMMRYMGMGESGEIVGNLSGDYEEEKSYPSKRIDAAIKLYEKSKQNTRDRLVEKLGPINSIVTMKGIKPDDSSSDPNPMDIEFNSVYGPDQMRCLALVSQNGMKETMMKFVTANQNVLRKFRLTGTNSTMAMLRSVFGGDDTVVFGPNCKSGPLGGDAQLVAMLCDEDLGGVIFFQDPLDSHPHNGDIDGLLRNTKIYNIMHASTTMSATMMMYSLRCGLEQGKPELFPSFFMSFQCPSVVRYSKKQAEVIRRATSSVNLRVISKAQIKFIKRATSTVDLRVKEDDDVREEALSNELSEVLGYMQNRNSTRGSF